VWVLLPLYFLFHYSITACLIVFATTHGFQETLLVLCLYVLFRRLKLTKECTSENK